MIKSIVSSLSPMSKNNLFTSVKKELPNSSKGHPSILKTTKEAVMLFLDRPDISYCKPGQKDTVYCGKNSKSENFFKPHHYLLRTYKVVVGLYNLENELQVTDHTVQTIVSEKKHLSASSTPEDDCKYEECENVELLLHSVKKCLAKANYHDLAMGLASDATDFVQNIVCSIKEFNSCNDACTNRIESTNIKEILQV